MQAPTRSPSTLRSWGTAPLVLLALGCQGVIESDGLSSPTNASGGMNGSTSGSGGGETPGQSGLTGDPAELCAQTGGTLTVGRTRLRRMTRAQLNHTMRDLVGYTDDPAAALAPDERIGPFYSNAIAPVDDLLVQQHAEIAAEIATWAESRMAELAPCDLAADATSACATQFIETFGKRAYRRPLTVAERDRYVALYELELATGTATDAFHAVIETVLQSPNFLHHVDVGTAGVPSATPVALSAYELASRLSYFLWDSMPDATLTGLADAGTLGDPTVLAGEVARMLADPRAADAIPSFHLQWLGIRDMAGLEKDSARFPQFDAALAAAMQKETMTFSDFVVRQGDGLLSTLFTASYSFPSGGLFGIYGVAQPAGFTPGTQVQLDPSQRSGLLTQAAFLATFSHRDQTSPVHRGIAVRENILCQPLDPPPANVNNVAPAVTEGTTTRDRFAAHVADPSCAGCHHLIDPIGLGFENYDPIGAYRTMEGNLPVDATGELTSVSDLEGTFDGAVELSHRLAESSQVAQCVANQWFRFALGRMEANDDACSIQDIHEGFAASGNNVRELLSEIVKSEAFLNVRSTGQ